MSSIDPANKYKTFTHQIDPARGVRGGREIAAAIARPGPRVVAPPSFPVATLPTRFEQISHLETLDTIPNQFVRYAFEHWRSVVEHVRRQLEDSEKAVVRRGGREAKALEDQLGRWLLHPTIAGASALGRFPASNQVLQRRGGYRDVFRAFVLSGVAAVLRWGGGEDVFGAGQRDVAVLYEYWIFLELARIVASLPWR